MHKFLFLAAAIITIISCKEQSNIQNQEDKNLPIVGKPATQLIWESDTTLTTSESVIFDAKNNVYYVSCINGVPPNAKDGDGFISKLSQNGEIDNLKWIDKLSAPKGMGLFNNLLYVADINELVIIDIDAEKIKERIEIKGSKFLNDIAIDEKGIVYISDTDENTIYSYKNGTIEKIIAKDISQPNGVFVKGNDLYVISFQNGDITIYENGRKNNTVINTQISNGDGIVKYHDNGFLCSNWGGEVYYLDANWEKHLLIDTKSSSRNAADIYFDSQNSVLVIPEFFGNKVSAYKLTRH